ncbi:DUF349 domain-containing protein [[Eubacterium] hominis]|uniref:DUF349 domain-containing protein n=1 Tax=[Eubacterium] hominis TaxID=2764325 RepID=UPI003A4E3902
MYNDHDEMYEVDDLDEDIKRREALIEEAKQIDPASDWNEVFREISDLKRRWKQIHYWESDYEDKLAEEFDSYIDVFYQKRREGYQNASTLKQELIDRAIVVATSNEWNKATEEMNDLMQQWKAAGSAGKDTDDALWEKFNEARQKFFDRKHDHWENLKSKFENARVVKQELIQKAAALCDSTEWQKTSEAYRELMEQWKAVGSAGKEHEDKLWQQFNDARQKFYDRRGAYYDELHEDQDQKYAQKKALVDTARELTERKEYTREHTEQMKNLGVEWKKIGSCGKEKEDQIWKEFRTVMDHYFEGLKEFNEQKHAQWRQRMQEIRSRKQEMIANQKRQIKRMQDDMVGLLGQRAIDEMEESIADKEDFIAQLEEEIEDIDKRLEK